MRRYFTEDPDPSQGQTSPPVTNDTIDTSAGADQPDTIGGDDVVQQDDQNETLPTEPTAPADEEQQREDPSA